MTGVLAVTILVVLLILAFLMGLAVARRGRPAPTVPVPVPVPTAVPEPVPGPEAEGRIPAAVPVGRVGEWLAPRLVGTPAALEPGETATPTLSAPGRPPARVVWVDGEDEALVHLDSITVRTTGTTLLVSIDLETDETGRAPVIVRFALGAPDQPGGLVAATDEVPHGDPVLVGRWGGAVQAALWSSLLQLAGDHATERGGGTATLAVADDHLVLQARRAVVR